ncbi:MAG: cyclomaltodextrinase N-terminal domain-containing protein, partial [Bacteroidales bacterium]|nr:cyclomaltodextrinase N-terminal domain-containing protein [Bacteroidales bacterium]
MKKRIVLVVALLWSISAAAQVERVEPPFWWAGMQTPLQIMIYGPGLGEGSLESASAGLEIVAVHKADSPNYLFVDVRLTEGAPGTYTLRWKKGRKKLD